jgi:hypothetical protein
MAKFLKIMRQMGMAPSMIDSSYVVLCYIVLENYAKKDFSKFHVVLCLK